MHGRIGPCLAIIGAEAIELQGGKAMKKIISTLATLVLAIPLAAPVFAATGAKGAKGQTVTQSASTKSTVKRVKATKRPATKVKKSTNSARKSAIKGAKSAPQGK